MEIFNDIKQKPRGGLLSSVFLLSIFLTANGVYAVFERFEESYHVNIFRGFFTSNQNSKYFESKYFKNILNFLRENPQQCELKEVKNKLVLKHNYIQNINDILVFLNQIKKHSE